MRTRIAHAVVRSPARRPGPASRRRRAPTHSVSQNLRQEPGRGTRPGDAGHCARHPCPCPAWETTGGFFAAAYNGFRWAPDPHQPHQGLGLEVLRRLLSAPGQAVNLGTATQTVSIARWAGRDRQGHDRTDGSPRSSAATTARRTARAAQALFLDAAGKALGKRVRDRRADVPPAAGRHAGRAALGDGRRARRCPPGEGHADRLPRGLRPVRVRRQRQPPSSSPSRRRRSEHADPASMTSALAAVVACALGPGGAGRGGRETRHWDARLRLRPGSQRPGGGGRDGSVDGGRERRRSSSPVRATRTGVEWINGGAGTGEGVGGERPGPLRPRRSAPSRTVNGICKGSGAAPERYREQTCEVGGRAGGRPLRQRRLQALRTPRQAVQRGSERRAAPEAQDRRRAGGADRRAARRARSPWCSQGGRSSHVRVPQHEDVAAGPELHAEVPSRSALANIRDPREDVVVRRRRESNNLSAPLRAAGPEVETALTGRASCPGASARTRR